MNKNDFYKELMTSYALDPEKIRMNALKQAKKPMWQKVASTCWKPAMGVAAAAAVTVGAVAFTNRPSAPDVIVAPEAAMSASQRLIEADRNYYNLADEETNTDMYVTFMEPVSYNEILMMLSAVDDSGSIDVCSVYLSDDIISSGEMDDFTENRADEDVAVAAKLSLPMSYYRDVQDLSLVYLAELGSAELNDDTFVPMFVEDDDPLENDHLNIVPAVTTTAPVVTTTPFSFAEISETTTEEAPVIGESADDSTVIPPANTTTVEDSEEITEETSVAVTTTTIETTPEETTTTTYFRGGVGLMTEIYELNTPGALSTCIVGNNVIVLSKENAYIYTIGGITGQYGDVVDVVNPRIAYKDESRIVLTGCNADGRRNILISVNAENDTYAVYDAAVNIGDSEIASVSYCEEADKFYLKAVSQTSSLIYELYVTDNTAPSFRPLVEVQAPISVAGSSGDVLYFITSSGAERTNLYSFNCNDGTLLEYASFAGDVKIKKSADFRSFAVILPDGSSFIFDAETNRLVSVQVDETVQIVSDRGETFFTVNGEVYKLNVAGEICNADRTVDFDREISQEFIINEITAEKVVVIRDDGKIW